MNRQSTSKMYRKILPSYQEGRFTRAEITAASERVKAKRREGLLPPPKAINLNRLGSVWIKEFLHGDAAS